MNEAHIDEKREMYKTYSTDKKQRQNQIEKNLKNKASRGYCISLDDEKNVYVCKNESVIKRERTLCVGGFITDLRSFFYSTNYILRRHIFIAGGVRQKRLKRENEKERGGEA